MIPKFRAWDKDRKYMEYTDENLLVCFGGNGKVVLTDLSSVYSNCEGMENFELMQSTGLKDINGTEIYEGDIVRYNRGISWSVEKFPYVVKNSLEGFVFEYGLIQHSLFLKIEYVTVIGNIYENPELLEDN
ncbi:YopX family protein [Staphylococcus hominis]|uniref:YopX family protein n=1 Tax=Staphylococcus hominis TaxID=1290 RepID=UPI001F5632BF|nr:YopX family protein [Staphylococcus hominis]MCI2862373.1 YopX family protein [Staphylococcus hominis]MCI2866338.1 YopX family protein [Staphylococcus hominis]MCI2878492.1 YopX family protein [Staphylococcus hominis]MCI2883995.1 YopX family protein [Staphylococcus hominis]